MTFAPREYLDELDEPAEDQRLRLLKLVGIPVLALLFVAAIWFAYRAGMQAGGDGNVPLITADETPFKVRPADPGGLDVPHRNVLIYDRLATRGAAQPKPTPEQLLPRAEEPMPRAALPFPPALLDEPVTVTPTEAPEPRPESLSQSAPSREATPLTTPSVISGYRVQLAALRTEAEAREAWDRLQRSYPGLLSSLQAQVTRTDLGQKGVYYRVQAGPLSEKILAEMLCGELKARKTECLVVQP